MVYQYSQFESINVENLTQSPRTLATFTKYPIRHFSFITFGPQRIRLAFNTDATATSFTTATGVDWVSPPEVRIYKISAQTSAASATGKLYGMGWR